MSRRKKKGSFRHDPFRKLKGLAVSSVEKGSDREPVEETAAPTAGPSADNDAFADEMARLGVQRSSGETAGAPAGETPRLETESEPEDSDEALFLAALEGMDSRFEDGFPVPEEPSASPRRMKQLRQGRLIPEEKIDLHGLSRAEVRTRVGYFLENAIYHGRKTVLIITGRGRGSGGAPVLRNEVERFLAEQGRTWAIEWGRAPRRYGGEGALVVFLKNASKR